MSFTGKRRILFLALGLFFAVSPVLAGNTTPGNIFSPQSVICENETYEVGEISTRIEASRKSRRRFGKSTTSSLHNTAIPFRWMKQYLRPALRIRPAYYVFLYRFNLF